MRVLWLVPVVASCTAQRSSLPTPESGAHLRLVVDDVTLPVSRSDADSVGIDFDDDDRPDNEIGDVIEGLAALGYARDAASVRGLIDAGRVPSVIDVFDGGGTESGDIVGLEYDGMPGAIGSVLRGSADGSGGFATVATQAASLTVLLPVLLDADPTPLQLDYAALEMSPTGDGGYDVRLQGLVEHDPLVTAACTSIWQLYTADPKNHAELITLVGGSDGGITLDDCVQSSFMHSLLAPDIFSDGQQYCSFGIALHVFTPPSVPPAEPR
jgi:hypothetical protein